jgi:integrase/recombinase XerD
MTDLAAMAQDYLRTRRALGYRLVERGRLLGQFVDYLQAHDADRLTVSAAVAWARQPASADPVWWNERLSVVRGFARYLTAFDPSTEVPPTGILPPGKRRITPYLFSDADLDRLLDAAGRLTAGLRADTYRTLIALMAVTGMRIGEAVGLDRTDIDWDQGLLTIRHAKFGKSRQIPLHATTVAALLGYARRRDALLPKTRQSGTSFFVSTTGTRLIPGRASALFGHLVGEAGLSNSKTGRTPRAHDLRHSFAVRTLLDWYRSGADVHQRLPLLSTYLGHVGPTSTYWYLHAAPELMALAAQRLDQHGEHRP